MLKRVCLKIDFKVLKICFRSKNEARASLKFSKKKENKPKCFFVFTKD